MHAPKTILNRENAMHYALRFPSPKSLRLRRHLEYFEVWLKSAFQVPIGAAGLISPLFKIHFLWNIALYPHSAPNVCFMPEKLDRKLRIFSLKEPGPLSFRQAASCSLAVIRWLCHEHQTKAPELISELAEFYRQVRALVDIKGFTYKQALQSGAVLEHFGYGDLPGHTPERDRVILLLTWISHLTPSQLATLSLSDFEILDPINWRYKCQAPNGETSIELEPYVALCILELCKARSLQQRPGTDQLLNVRTAGGWRALSESEIEIIIECHYRFIEALEGPDFYLGLGLQLDPEVTEMFEHMTANELTQSYEELLPTGIFPRNKFCQQRQVLDRTTAEARTGKANDTATEIEDCDWDAVIQKRCRAAQDDSEQALEYRQREALDEQVNWEDAIVNQHKT